MRHVPCFAGHAGGGLPVCGNPRTVRLACLWRPIELHKSCTKMWSEQDQSSRSLRGSDGTSGKRVQIKRRYSKQGNVQSSSFG